MVSPTDHTVGSSTEQKIVLKSKINRLNASSLQTNASMIDEEAPPDPSWTSSDDPTSKSPAIVDFYPDSYSSSSSVSSFDFHSSNNDSNPVNRPELKTSSSSSGYESSLTSIPDHLFPSTSNSISIPYCHFIEQFVHSHLDEGNSSPPSSISSLSSQEPISAINSPSCCRKCLHNNQLSSDTDDDSQSTTIPTNYSSSPKRPRSLPIAIQQPKTALNTDETENDSSFCQYTNEPPTTINAKNSLEHFIMSPTDKVKIQMKYQENDMKKPEEIDFKRSKLKTIRVLYQNRFNLNSIPSPMGKQKSAGHGESPLVKRTGNPQLLRSVFEADDEHEVISTTTRTGVVLRRQEKSLIETFHCLRVNFIESLLHGKILPCGILDGFTVKLGASGLFLPKQVVLPVTTFWFNISEHQAASPYLGFINLQCLPKRGYHTPIKGTITLALLNPNGTAIHLFVILYDFSDMPADHRTFIRQRIILIPEHTGDKKENLRYLAHIRFVTSQTGKLYMHSDIRLIFARNRLDYDERTGNGRPQLITLTDIPTPKYWPRR